MMTTPNLDDLLARMTWAEKLGQLQIIWRRDEDDALALARGGIGALFWPQGAVATNALQRAAVEESRHGIPLLIGLDVVHGQFTIFPTPLAQAASFDPSVAAADARVSAAEARSGGVNWTFSPMVDVTRDPRWGRVVEGFGEDAFLTAAVPGSAAISIGQGTGLDLTVQAFPPADGQEPFTLASANYAWAINASSDDAVKASAQAFLDWLAEPEQAQEFADLSGFVPITGATADNVNAVYEPIAGLLETGAFAGLPNATWPNPAVYDTLGVGVQGLLTGQKTVDQVLEEMDAAWDQ